MQGHTVADEVGAEEIKVVLLLPAGGGGGEEGGFGCGKDEVAEALVCEGARAVQVGVEQVCRVARSKKILKT